MKPYYIFLVAFIAVTTTPNAQGLENLIGTSIQQCLNCLCHARSGCWSRFNCARYSISQEYWIQAGSPTVEGSTSDLNLAYKACMSNENCVLNTLKTYTEQFGAKDCNCDSAFDCKDRLAIHLFGESCTNPEYGYIYSRRFNDCAQQIGVATMSAKEGSCDILEVDAV